MSSHYSDGTGPENLDSFAGDMQKLRALCHNWTREELLRAYAALHAHQPEWKKIVKEEIEERDRKEADAAADRRHQDAMARADQANRLALWAFWLSLFSILLSLAMAAIR
jgi:hypothetical protein